MRVQNKTSFHGDNNLYEMKFFLWNPDCLTRSCVNKKINLNFFKLFGLFFLTTGITIIVRLSRIPPVGRAYDALLFFV